MIPTAQTWNHCGTVDKGKDKKQHECLVWKDWLNKLSYIHIMEYNNKKKAAEGKAQVVEQLSSKCEALSWKLKATKR
jgi:hypothetical protein